MRLTLNSIKIPSKTKRKYTSDMLYAGLLRKMVAQAYGEYADKVCIIFVSGRGVAGNGKTGEGA